MASGIVMNLQEEVTCPICLELLTEPLSLDCGHSFCQACITANNMVSMSGQNEERRCPVCRISYEPGNLRPNRHVANIVQRLREIKLSPEVEQEKNLCLRHGEKLLLFCEEDREVICWLCERSQEHCGHHTFLMEEVAQDYQKKLQEALEKLREKQLEAEELEVKVRAQIAAWKDQIQHERQNVKAVFQKLRKNLKYEEVKEMQKLKSKEEVGLRNLADSERVLIQQSQLVRNLISDVDRRLKGSTTEMLQGSETSGSQAEKTMYNLSCYNPDSFILAGIPGLEKFHIWIGIPFCVIYALAVVGNGTLLYLIVVEDSLHEPMFFFLFMLATTDLILSTATVPKLLSNLWLGSQEITFTDCLTQMFFLHFSFVVDSAILLAMALDRYVAICFPLRYTTVLAPQVIIKLVVGIVVRSFLVILPDVFLLKRLPFCGTRIIPHTYCEHIGVAQLSSANISINIWYGFSVPVMTVVSDVIFIAVSYIFILRAVFHLSSQGARQKALGTCGSHICVILMFYTPAAFSILAHRFGHSVPRNMLILFANLYVAIPPALNPIVYGVKTKKIQDKFILLFTLKKKQ
ncbi:hypothetical protein G4228_000724 [Cervus hanglu yarkandensis]|nr:hypothetical protein G4228_000724 [Cervus hanglu yarkandensis]